MKMNKAKILGEIQAFLEGYNDELKYLVNVETNSNNNIAECIIHPPGDSSKIIRVEYEPFLYMKDLSKHNLELYKGLTDDYVELKRLKYGVTVTKLKTGNQKRLVNGFCYKITSSKSYNDILNFLRDGGVDPYYKLRDINDEIVRNENGDPIQPHKEYFYTIRKEEQFFISTQSRLYKGFETYKEVHRLTFDIETTGLRYQSSRMFSIGVRDNRGFETVLEVDKFNDDESEIKLIQDFFNLVDRINPAIILGHNSEEFDFEYILGRAKILNMDLTKVPTGLKEGVYLKRRPNTSVKYGNTTDKYTATIMWGRTVIDTLHAAKRTAAINTDIEYTNLKYIAKFENFARENRTYIKGEDNSIGRFYTENKLFLVNNKNEYIEIPDKYQDISTKLFKIQANKNKLGEKNYSILRTKYLNEDKNGFVDWYRKECTEKKYSKFISGKLLVRQYLLDDLYETSQVDELYNQSSFMLAKIVPTVYQKICTMGTASIWNLLLTAWSYENDLAIPDSDVYEYFGGGLARTYKSGYITRIIKIDYASLYPMIQLSEDVFPFFDITGVMKKILLYSSTTRNIYKKLGGGNQLNNEEIELLKEIDPKVYYKLINNEITDSDKAMFKVKQFPIKILNNSLYGALGSNISFNWSDNVCAARITGVARLRLRQMVAWFNKFGFIPLYAVTDGVNFQIPLITNIRVIDDKIIQEEVEKPIDEMWKYGEKIGYNALIDKFNNEEMPPPYMSVDNDGESISCLNVSRINYATLNEEKDRKTGEIKEKIKLTGNTLKSKTMPEYIKDFFDKGFKLILRGKGSEFVDYYYDYAEDIRYMRIPLKKIASKSKIKTTLRGYDNRGKDKNGKPKSSQAHMELLKKQRNDIAEELFEQHKDKFDLDNVNEELTVKEKMMFVADYMSPEPELDSTVYYVNTGERKSHGDVKKDQKTGEIILRCKLIDKKALQDNPNMLGEYNYEKYLDAFNKKIMSLLVGFEPDVAKKIPAFIERKGKNKGHLHKEMFTKDDLTLKMFDLDSLEESMYLEEKEVKFWNKTGYDPRLVWNGFKTYDDAKIYYEIYEHALNYLNEKMKEANKSIIKSINDEWQSNDYVLVKDNDNYHLGMYTGVYLKIIKENIEIPKCKTELEIEKLKQEQNKKVNALKSSELIAQTEKEKEIKIKKAKREKYLPLFMKEFNVSQEMLDDEYACIGIYEMLDVYIINQEQAAEIEAANYLEDE